MRPALLVLVMGVNALTLKAEHPPLLPQPQQIQYGAGRLSLRGLSIKAGSDPSLEDQFAAAELSSILSRRAGTTIPVATGNPAGPVITLVRTGAVEALPGPDDHAGPDSREAYVIRIDPRGAEIRARSSAGVYYGVQTMRQLVEGDGGDASLPEVSIHDWPAMAYRGFMMDMSHGPLPSENEVKRQIDFLARWKNNQYYFYSEASIELRGYELVNPDGRYSQEQVRRIIDYARARHIDVVPTAELYGHLHDVFRIERYADLSLTPHSGEIHPRNERTAAFVADWVQQIAALFPSPWMHIGFDEPWELERAGIILGGVDPGSLWIDRLKQTFEWVEKAGKRPMFWADVHSGAHTFEKYPALLSQLPKSVIAVPWTYRPQADYTAFVEPFAREHIQQVVAPGIDCYNEFAPDFYYTFANIDGLVRDGRKYGALGEMNTGWTDSSQMLYRQSLPAMAYGAVAAWQTAPVNEKQFFSDYSTQMYPANAAADVAFALDKLSAAEATLKKTLGGGTIGQFWADPLAPAPLTRIKSGLAELREARLQAEDAQERLQRALASTQDTYSLPSLLVAARMLDYIGMKYLYAGEIAAAFESAGKNPSRADVSALARQITSQDHSLIADMLDMLTMTRELYRSGWLDEYTHYRLAFELGRWDLEYAYWSHLQYRLNGVFRGFKDGDTLPSLDDLRPHP
jgi:hypothetical protein